MPRPKTPSQRAAEHAQFVKEQEAKRKEKSSPGPGAYDPVMRKTLGTHGSNSAFKSGVDRNKPAASTPSAMDVGDPGAYNMIEHKSLALQASKSHSKSSMSGVSSFGSTSKRELKLANSIHPTNPGSAIEPNPDVGLSLIHI